MFPMCLSSDDQIIVGSPRISIYGGDEALLARVYEVAVCTEVGNSADNKLCLGVALL